MAKVTKRRLDADGNKGGAVRSGNPKVAAAAKAERVSGHTSDDIVVDEDAPAPSSRYTPKAIDKSMMPSPMWVPVLMFTFFGLGVLSIFLNYTGILPGAPDSWYLVGGLGAILAGIITATQYR